MNDEISLPDLTRIDFFKELPARRRQHLASKLVRIEFSPGSLIIKKGQSGDFLAIIESGQVVLENADGSNRVLTADCTFGSEMLRYGKPSSVSFHAQTETSVWILKRSDWLAPSPASPPRNIPARKPGSRKAAKIAAGIFLILAMAFFTLGPTLIESANKTIPKRLVDSGRPDLAEEYLRFMIRWQPVSARVYGYLADNLVIQGKGQEAVEAYQQAITLDPYLPWIHNNLGVLLMYLDKAELAVEQFQAALDLNSESIETYRNLGNAYYALEQWEEASNAYQRALDLDSSLLDIKAERAGIILYESQLDEARQAWEEVLLVNPRQPLALQGLGVVSLLEEDPTLAMLYLDAARYIDPDDPTTRLFIGLALEALDRPEEAAAEYQTVIEMGSNLEVHSLADTLLQVLQQ